MTARFFSNNATAAALAADITDINATTFSLAAAPSGWPSSTPFTAAIDKDLATEEVILVTALSGTSVTCTRGYDGSTKRTHKANGPVVCVASAIDFVEANAHVNASAGVHGLTGSVVGTTDTQTLTGKTLTTPIIADLSGMAHDHGSTAKGGPIPQSSVTGLTTALANIPQTSVTGLAASFTAKADKTYVDTQDTAISNRAPLVFLASARAGTTGTAGQFGYETDTGTLYVWASGWQVYQYKVVPRWEIVGGAGLALPSNTAVQYTGTTVESNIVTLASGAATITVPGPYQLGFGTRITDGGTTNGEISVFITVDRGATTNFRRLTQGDVHAVVAGGVGSARAFRVAGTLRLQANDVVKAWVFHNVGSGSLNIDDHANETSFTGTWLGN